MYSDSYLLYSRHLWKKKKKTTFEWFYDVVWFQTDVKIENKNLLMSKCEKQQRHRWQTSIITRETSWNDAMMNIYSAQQIRTLFISCSQSRSGFLFIFDYFSEKKFFSFWWKIAVQWALVCHSLILVTSHLRHLLIYPNRNECRMNSYMLTRSSFVFTFLSLLYLFIQKKKRGEQRKGGRIQAPSQNVVFHVIGRSWRQQEVYVHTWVCLSVKSAIEKQTLLFLHPLYQAAKKFRPQVSKPQRALCPIQPSLGCCCCYKTSGSGRWTSHSQGEALGRHITKIFLLIRKRQVPLAKVKQKQQVSA